MAFCSSAGRGDELLRRMNALSLQSGTSSSAQTAPPPKPASKPSQGLAASRWADDPEPPKPKASSMTNRHKPSIGAYTLAQAQKSTPSLTSAPRPSTSPNPNPPTPPPNYDTSSATLSLLTMSMRKLREGILASHRCDAFTTQVYIFIIRLSILLRQWESYHPALLHLLNIIRPRRPLSKLELSEFAGYLVLDLACRQGDLAKAEETRVRYGVDGKVGKVVKAIVYDDYVGFWRLTRAVDGHRAKIMEYAEENMRLHALKCIGRAYFQVPKEFVEHMTNAKWEVLVEKYKVGWELKGEEVIIRKPKVK